MTRRPRALRRAVGVLACSLACRVAAEPADSTAPPAAAAETGAAADAARRSVRDLTHWMARGIDGWFGDRPFDDGGKVSDGRLSVVLNQRQREPVDVNVRFSARLRLPNLEERTYVFLGRDDPDEVLSDQPGPLSRQDRLLAQANADRQFFAGIGRSLTDQIDFRLGFRGALKPYVQGRYRVQWSWGDEGLAELRQTVFWSLADRAGATTAFSYEHLLSPVLAARWLSSVTTTQASGRFDASSLLGVYRSFGNQRLLSAEAVVSGYRGSGVVTTDGGLQARWEQPVHRHWLLGQVVVGHFWPRPDADTPRRGAWALGTGLRMQF